MNPEFIESYKFFHKHYSSCVVGESAVNAIALARAEAWAKKAGVIFQWEDEIESYQDVFGEPAPKGYDMCWLQASLGELQESLGMIALSQNSFRERKIEIRVQESELSRDLKIQFDSQQRKENFLTPGISPRARGSSRVLAHHPRRRGAIVSAPFGFEALVDGQWSAEACGDQNRSNYLATREEAEAQLPGLAKVLECDVADLRVVEVRS